MKLFNHVQIKVKYLENSQKFYDSIMNILGYQKVLEIKDTVIGYGTDVHDMFEIRIAKDETLLSNSVHIAFNAPSVQTVNEFYKAAIKMVQLVMVFLAIGRNMKRVITLHLL